MAPTKALTSGYNRQLYIGGDPEIFFSLKGEIIGSEKVIEKTIPFNADYGPGSSVVRDGVQGEIVLPAFHCRATGGSHMSIAMRALIMHLLKRNRHVQVDFRQVIDVNEDEFNGLDESSRILGCAPSKNIYDPDRPFEVPPDKLRMRSAGGHVHVGLNGVPGMRPTQVNKGSPCHPLLDDPTQLVQLYDVVVGNTCVLIDREPRAAERRMIYGRAGEYRLPAHGIEYRTLSNWWLRGYPLASFVWGMMRFATAIYCDSKLGAVPKPTYDWSPSKPKPVPAWDAAGELLASVDIHKVQEAINTNDAALAAETWQIVRGFIGAYTGSESEAVSDGAIPLITSTLEDFDYFLLKGLDHWFPVENALMQWLCFNNGHGMGWEAFLKGDVRKERLAEAGAPILKKTKPRKLKEAA